MGLLYNKVLEVVEDARNCYIDGSTHVYNDEEFTRMMLRDGCFILFFIECIARANNKVFLNSEYLGALGFANVSRDILLLENQIPFVVLEVLFDFRFPDKGEEILNRFFNYLNYGEELTNSKILLHSLGRDDEVVKMYEEIEAPAVNIYMFNHLRRGIEKHCTSRYKTWAAELITVYFSSPWKTVALLVATAILVTSFLQTYFAIRPLSDDSHEDFVKLLKRCSHFQCCKLYSHGETYADFFGKERQMPIHFNREMDDNRADARELIRLIAEVEEHMNHMAALIREVEIFTGSILAVEGSERQMPIHFNREMDDNRADARELIRLIAEVEEHMNHMAALIREVEIFTGSILAVEGSGVRVINA
nr:uncharacterized protein [Tanacetum cinerariifolium]